MGAGVVQGGLPASDQSLSALVGQAEATGGVELAGASNPTAASQLDEHRLEALVKDPETGWKARVEALDKLSQLKFQHEPSGTPASLERMIYEADMLGLKLETHETVYRVDTRPPESVLPEGFKPRTDKPSGSILTHIESKTGNMVSGTSAEGNDTIFFGLAQFNHLHPIGEDAVKSELARIEQQFLADVAELKRLVPDITPWDLSFTNAAMIQPGSVTQAAEMMLNVRKVSKDWPAESKVLDPKIAATAFRTPEALVEAGYNIWGNPSLAGLIGRESMAPIQQSYLGYEYRLKGVSGVAVSQNFRGFDFVAQREVTMTEVRPEQIDAVREVYVHTTRQGYIHGRGLTMGPGDVALEFGEWQLTELSGIEALPD